jgi:UDP-GlcNAc:undecaprenyl-phosphate GlcNAc-1-phosphate transferase
VFLLAAFILRYQSDFAVLGTWGFICALILLFFILAAHTGWQARPENDPADRRNSVLRRFDWLYWTCRLYIEFGLLIYLWIMILAMYKSFKLFSESEPFFLASLVATSLLVFLFKRPLLNSVIKLCVYITATFSGFILTSDHFNNPYIDIGVAAYLTALMVVIFIGIRVTRRNVFSFSTQDLLISLFAVAAVLLSDTPFPVNFLFKLLCLAYGIEYLFNFPLRSYKLLKISALLSGLMVFSVLSQGYDAKSELFNAENTLSYSAFFSTTP